VFGGPVGALAGVAAGAALGQATAPSPTMAHRTAVAQAMHSTASPTELRALARRLEPVGLDGPLKARAALRETPDPDMRGKLQASATSKDPAEVEAESLDFKRVGAQATAELLRDYSRGLKAVAAAGGPDATPEATS
jgi:hypothetical protein